MDDLQLIKVALLKPYLQGVKNLQPRFGAA